MSRKDPNKLPEAQVETLGLDEILDLVTEHMSLNRPKSNNTVARYAHAMKHGQWKLNGQTIVIDDKGNVIDGQHRLAAALEAEVPLTTFVVRGVPTDVFDSLDQGKTRNIPQYLAIRGESSSAQLATGLRLLWSWERGWEQRGGRPGKDMSVADTFELLDKHPEIRQSIAKWSQHAAESPFKGAAGASVFAFMHYAAWHTSGRKGQADAWLEGIMTGKDLTTGDPRLAARNRLLLERGKDGRRQSPRGLFNRLVIIAMLIRSWNAYAAGKDIHELRMTLPDEMPEFRGEEGYWKRVGRPMLPASNGHVEDAA